MRLGAVARHGLVRGAQEVAAAAGERALAVRELLAARVVRRRVAAARDAPLLAQVEGDVGGVSLVGRVEVDVVGDEERPRADDRRAGGGVERRGAEVRLPGRVGELLCEALVLAAPDVREAAARRVRRGRLVEVHGDAELGAHAGAEAARDGHAVLHRHALDGHERADVRRPHARVSARVPAHVDDLRGPGDARERGALDGLRAADEGDHGAMGVDAQARR